MQNPWRHKTPVIVTVDGRVTEITRCEMCNKPQKELIEVGLYWVCDTQKCCDKAEKQVNKDIDIFHKNGRVKK